MTALLLTPVSPEPVTKLVDALCAAERPESILTWERSPEVHQLLAGLGAGHIPLTHAGLDEMNAGRSVEHLRAHGL